MRTIFLSVCLFIGLPVLASAQFNSGSTGADGALDLGPMTCPNNVCEVQLSESGILNYTTVNIPSGKTLSFRRNSRNTSVTLLAQGNVTIGGAIDVSALGELVGGYCGNFTFPPRRPGPGGFWGGLQNQSGLGPGGGQSTPLQPGSWVGPLSLYPIVGGSGGGGDATYRGGCGGGALLIASSTSITMNSGTISAQGATDWTCYSSWIYVGAPGAGGAIRLVANSVTVNGGGFNACNLFGSNCGVVRLEAQPNQVTFTGSSNPPATISPINPAVYATDIPKLTIQSVGGYSVPTYSGSRFDTNDLLLPSQISDPVSVGISSNNIPVGTVVNVSFVSGSPGGTSTSCNLSGTFASSTCTATISNLNRTVITYLLATAAFTPPTFLAKYNRKGPHQVAKIRLETVLGAKQKYVFLGKNEKVIENSKIKKEFLQYFGM